MASRIYSKIPYLIVALFFFTLGCVITIWVKKNNLFVFSNKLKLTDAISMALTVIMGLFIAFYVDKAKNVQRVTKDMFISYYNSYLEFLREKISLVLEEQSIHQRFLYFKLIRTRLYNLRELSTERKMIEEENIQFNELFNEVTLLWKESTYSNQITDKNKENMELSLIKIEGIIHKLVLEINDY